MGFYAQVIAPRIMDWSLSSQDLAKYRQEVLSNVQGEVLEIGFGTGINLSYYPKQLEKLVTVDANPGMNALAQKRLENSTVTVDNRVLNGENLPMSDCSFDCVVSTWTLCSIKDVEQAIAEIHRVLKPGGKFYFVEHGLSNEPSVQIWQNRLNFINKALLVGCHINRNIKQLIATQFDELTIEEFYDLKSPKIHGYMYKGVATKAA
ncbi:MAG: class I SAM-dependent methyltransferase [Coleofasciculaceae cyanobacterium]